MAKNHFTCPHCNRQLWVGLGADWQPVKDLQQNTISPLSNIHSGYSEYQKVTPIGKLEPRDVVTSIFDAGISFALFSVASSALFWFAELPLLFGPAVGFLIGSARYFGGVQFAKGLLATVETIVKEIAEPEPAKTSEPIVINAEIKEGKHSRWQFANLPGERGILIEFANDVLGGKSFSERTAVKCGLTQDQFCGLRDVFIERGWAEWKHPTRKQQGAQLGRNGLAILRAICGHQ